MGWFWGSSDGDDGKKSQDPFRDLDPSLREFLAKESPVKYSSSNPPSTQPTTLDTQNAQTDSRTGSATPKSTSSDAEPKVPRESLYQDGRYAHLWKRYQAQAEIDNAFKTDQEKLQDVLDGYSQRKTEIGRAALENCALEQWEVNECFRSGGWQKRLTMCRTENRGFERCYLMQGKFLKALGYLSTFDRPAEVDEQIQMHADTLYHRMLEQEKVIEAAKAEGRPVPTFPPILSTVKTNSTKSPANSTPKEISDNPKIGISNLKPEVQAKLKKRLKGLTSEERELEERAIDAEIQAGTQVAEHVGTQLQKQDEERAQRKAEGKETIGDRIISIFRIR